MLGLGTSLVKGGKVGRAYVKDGLKLYMPYRGDNITKGTQFVGTGSTSFDDGSSQYISGTGDCPASAFTVSAWIKKVGASGWYAIYSADTEIWFGLGASEEIRLHVGGSDRIDTAVSSVTIGTWHHVSATYDGSTTGKIYIDGVDQALTSSGTLNVPIATASNIGRHPNGSNYFDGSIKNVAIWERALTATEIQNVMYKSYTEVSGRLASGLVSWWSLETSSTDNPAG